MNKQWATLGLILALVFLSTSCENSPTNPGYLIIGCDEGELIDAILSANAAPDEDTIILAQDCSYDFHNPFQGDQGHSRTALPTISTPITLYGAETYIFIGYGRDSLSRLFYISSQGSLKINSVSFGTRTQTNSYCVDREDGGGYLANDGELIINKSEFTNGHSRHGGAVYNRGNLVVRSSSFSMNTFICDTYTGAIHHGGAIYNQGGAVLIEDSAFEDYFVSESGGAVYSRHHLAGNLTISRCEFRNNHAESSGGAVYSSGITTVENSVFQGNSTYEVGGDGGGLWAGAGKLYITASTFSSNYADRGGGLFYQPASDWQNEHFLSVIYQSGFYHNLATEGSAIYITGALSQTPNTIENNTFSHNSGYSTVFDEGRLNFRYNTVAFNEGAGLKTGSYQLPVYVTGTLIANNGTDCSSNLIEASGENLDSDGSCAGFTITADPALYPLADNGGSTLTHALPGDSPASDATNFSCPAMDQRGESRPGYLACDLGAFERTLQAPGISSFGERQREEPAEEPPEEAKPEPEIDFCIARVLDFAPCKEGPGNEYPTINSLDPKGIVEVKGQSEDGNYAVIRDPCQTNRVCWVDKLHLLFFCDHSSLPIESALPVENTKPEGSSNGTAVCNPEANSQSECETSGGTWTMPLAGGSWYCQCD